MADILFTGTGVYKPHQSSGREERAFSEMGERILATEKMKLDKALKDEANFLDAIQVDPIQLIAQKASEEQQSSLEAFNKKYAQVFSDRKGNLTTADKINMQREKQALLNRQNEWLVNQKRFEQDANIMANPINWDKYDINAFRAAYKEFLKTGKYPQGALQPAPANLDEFFNKNPLRTGTEQTGFVEGTDSRGKYSVTTKWVGSREEADDYIKSMIMYDNTGRNLKGAVAKFESLGKDVQKKYLDMADANNNNKIDVGERDNAIIYAMQDIYRDQVLVKSVGNRSYVPAGSASGGGGARKNPYSLATYTPPKADDNVKIGDTIYNNVYWFSNLPTRKYPIDGTIRAANLVAYVPSVDSYWFKVVREGRPDQDVLVPAESVQGNTIQELENYEVEKDGRIITIGDLRRGGDDASGKKPIPGF